MTAGRSAPTCRGWELVAEAASVTPAERQAASGHLRLCRACRGELRRRQQRARRRRLGGLTGTAGGLLAGKTALGLAGAATVAAASATGLLLAHGHHAPGRHLPVTAPRPPGRTQPAGRKATGAASVGATPTLSAPPASTLSPAASSPPAARPTLWASFSAPNPVERTGAPALLPLRILPSLSLSPAPAGASLPLPRVSVGVPDPLNALSGP